MIGVARWAAGDGMAWMAIQVVIQISVVVGLAWVLDRLLSRRPAAARHAVWLCALAMILIGPAIVLIAGRAEIALVTIRWECGVAAVGGRSLDDPGSTAVPPMATPVLAVHPAERTSRAPVRKEVPQAEPIDPATGGPTRSSPNAILPAADARPPMLAAVLLTILAVWLGGAIVLVVRFARGLIVLADLRRSARPIDIAELRGVNERVRSALGLADLPTIAISLRVNGPVAVGLLRPMVILPDGLVGVVSVESLVEVLIHECAHIARQDPLIGLLQRLVALIYWPHPLIHVLNRRLCRAREEACDDLVVAHADPIDYARTLLSLAERSETGRRPRWALALFNSSWKLEDRIGRILDPRRKTAARLPFACLLAAGAVVLAGGVVMAGVRWEAAQAASPTRSTPVAVATEPGAVGRPIRGIVVDQAGKPLAGASVRLIRDWKAPGGAVTGADGTFIIRDRSPLMLLQEELIAVGDDGRRQGMGVFRESLDSRVPTAPAQIVLKPSRAVTVVVNDEAGKPVADASVEVVAEYNGIATARTGAGGRVKLHYPEGPKVELIVALKSGVGFDYFENYRSWPSEGSSTAPDTVTLVLNGARSARLKAVDSSGNPVADVEFGAWIVKKRGKLAEANIGGGRIARSRTDRGGIATFDWLPADAAQTIAFHLIPGDYHAPERPIFTPDYQPPIKPVRLVRKVTLRGKVLDPDGRPAPGILVEATGVGKTFNDQYNRGYARTAADGTYALAVAPDHSYMVVVNDQSWAARSQTGIVVRREGETRDVPDLRLIKGTLLHGHVTIGPDHQPLAGSWIALTQHGDPLPRDYDSRTGDRERLHQGVETDQDGRYAFRVGPGTYGLSGPGDAHVAAVVVEAQDEIVRDFHVESLDGVKNHHLRGQVHDLTSGKRVPVAGALLTAFRSRGREVDGRADADGRFDLSIWYDPSFLYARNPEGTRAGFVAVRPGVGLALVHLAPASRVTGRVTDRGGKPLSGWRVWLLMEARAESGAAIQLRRETVTDDRGRYTFAGLVVGARCELSVPPHPEPWDGSGPITREEVTVGDSNPIKLRDLVISQR